MNNIMVEHIILKKNPKIEFQFHDNGFNIIDGLVKSNTGFYTYNELGSVNLNHTWFPLVAKWLRIATGIMNGVPFFPDAESYKKSSLIIHSEKSKLGIWLIDSYMVTKAKEIKKLLEAKTTSQKDV